MDGKIARLIGLLDDDSTEVVENPKAELISAAVPSSERFGQLSAIVVFELYGDPGPGRS